MTRSGLWLRVKHSVYRRGCEQFAVLIHCEHDAIKNSLCYSLTSRKRALKFEATHLTRRLKSAGLRRNPFECNRYCTYQRMEARSPSSYRVGQHQVFPPNLMFLETAVHLEQIDAMYQDSDGKVSETS